MKLIANRNYYQKKNRDCVEIDREIQEEMLRMTPEEKAAAEREQEIQFERLRAKYDAVVASTRYVKCPLKEMRFLWVSKAALVVAEHFEMNVFIEEGGDTGFVRFTSDQVLSERIWKDQRYRNQFLRLMRWADGVWIDTKEEYGVPLVQISLSYRIAKSIRICTKAGAAD